jgi:superoxide reductase
MPSKAEVYKCAVCANIIEILHAGKCIPECCGKEMILQKENSVDAATEKHIPVITKEKGGYRVKIGSIPHPMEADHYIEWIELIAGDISYRAFLKPGDLPEAFFAVEAANVSAREYCNKHGLWRA